jgi:hypothetical protein
MSVLRTERFKLLSIMMVSIGIVVVFFQAIYSQGFEFHFLKGINDNGQTYGLDSDGLDLIAAQGADGTYGYVLREDIEPEFKSLEEALEWQEQHQDKQAIPLYASDGKTIVGEFELISSGDY